jgi:hypothetical protein
MEHMYSGCNQRTYVLTWSYRYSLLNFIMSYVLCFDYYLADTKANIYWKQEPSPLPSNVLTYKCLYLDTYNF